PRPYRSRRGRNIVYITFCLLVIKNITTVCLSPQTCALAVSAPSMCYPVAHESDTLVSRTYKHFYLERVGEASEIPAEAWGCWVCAGQVNEARPGERGSSE